MEKELENEKKVNRDQLKKINNLQSELDEEKNWWDKWEKAETSVKICRKLLNNQLGFKHLLDEINHDLVIIDKDGHRIIGSQRFLQVSGPLEFKKSQYNSFHTDEAVLSKALSDEFRRAIKIIYIYYRNGGIVYDKGY